MARPSAVTNGRGRIRLRLYVAGHGPNSMLAIANAKAICEDHFANRHELEVVDLMEHPRLAAADGVIVTPTLIRVSPLPVQRVIGNLNDRARALVVLNAR